MEDKNHNSFRDFAKKKEYLVCIDSDGCVMDTMDIKHYQCFGPCMVEEWELDLWKEDILLRWNQVNLYSMSRGMNRFATLAILLSEINDRYKKIPDIEHFIHWTETADELSNRALSEEIEVGEGLCLVKALHWSEEVNRGIEQLPESSKLPFAGAKEGLKYVHQFADVAIVSSANPDAVEAEWRAHGLLEHVDIMLAQNAGSKAFCIGKLMEYGYERHHVMMVGDAPGDFNAAEKNQVYFYPILVSREGESWNGIDEAVKHLMGHTWDTEYQRKLIEAFEGNLKA